jgi:hypothetical protein
MANAEMMPMSDERLLTENDLRNLSASDLRIARNEIFARHGYAFKSTDLLEHFLRYDWYQPRERNVTLSDIERQNVEFLRRYEGNPAALAAINPSNEGQQIVRANTPEAQSTPPSITLPNQTDLEIAAAHNIGTFVCPSSYEISSSLELNISYGSCLGFIDFINSTAGNQSFSASQQIQNLSGTLDGAFTSAIDLKCTGLDLTEGVNSGSNVASNIISIGGAYAAEQLRMGAELCQEALSQYQTYMQRLDLPMWDADVRAASHILAQRIEPSTALAQSYFLLERINFQSQFSAADEIEILNDINRSLSLHGLDIESDIDELFDKISWPQVDDLASMGNIRAIELLSLYHTYTTPPDYFAAEVYEYLIELISSEGTWSEQDFNLRIARDEALLRLEVFYSRGDYEKVYSFATDAAEGGIVEANFYLGMLYANGDFVERNPSQALSFMQIAATIEFKNAASLIVEIREEIAAQEQQRYAADLHESAARAWLAAQPSNISFPFYCSGRIWSGSNWIAAGRERGVPATQQMLHVRSLPFHVRGAALDALSNVHECFSLQVTIPQQELTLVLAEEGEAIFAWGQRAFVGVRF